MGRAHSLGFGLMASALAVLGGCSEQRPLAADVAPAPALTLTAVTPAAGPPAGGQLVTLQGSGFVPGATVSFGGTVAGTVTLQGDGTLAVITPAGAPGAVTVTVTNPSGANASLPAAYHWIGPNVEQSTDPAHRPDIAIDGAGVLHVVWDATPSGATAVRWTKSTDGGVTWSTPVTLNSPGGVATRPRIAVQGNRVAVAWNLGTGTGRFARYALSTDSGATWGVPVSLTAWVQGRPNPDLVWNAAGDLVLSYIAPGVASNGAATPMLVWTTVVSPTGGPSAPSAVSGANTVATGHAIAADGSTVAVTWTRTSNIGVWQPPNHVKVSLAAVAVSPDGGYSFGVPVQLDSAVIVRDAAEPAVAVRGATITCVWRAPQVAAITTFDDIGIARSLDSGISWSPSATVAGGGTVRRQAPAVVIHSAALTSSIVWAESTTGVPDVFRARLPFGATTGIVTNLSANTGLSLAPQIAAGPGATALAYTVWSDNSAGVPDILIK